MRYLALATDYDGTLASSGRVQPTTVGAIERLKASGRRALLVTGRRVEDLLRVFPELALFDYVVAENGAVLYEPARKQLELLGERPSERFVAELERLEVRPLVRGEVILATLVPEREKLLSAIHKLGLEAQIVFNGDAAMVLPHGINKATGTARALRKMGLTFHEVVGVGDSENDHSLLKHCECAVAVSNAIDSIKEAAAHVTRAEAGAGVEEVIAGLLENDLSDLAPKLRHKHIELGRRRDGGMAAVSAYGHNMLIAGPSGSGKSTFATGFIERLLSRQYQVCIVDPEGDYGTLQDIVALGSPRRAPAVSEVLGILEDPIVNVSVNLLGVPLADRPEYLSHLLPGLQAMRARTSRPHWLVIDEAHHLLPSAWGAAPVMLPQRLGETILLTVHPDQVAPPILRAIDTVVAVGPHPDRTLAEFSEASGRSYSGHLGLPERKDEVIVWQVGLGQEPITLKAIPGTSERLRHLRKYAEGDLGSHSFYFHGPDRRLNLKAQNLGIFVQIAEGLDPETWSFHLEHGDISRWFREKVKDEHLASETQRIERRQDLEAQDARRLVCELVRARYAI